MTEKELKNKANKLADEFKGVMKDFVDKELSKKEKKSSDQFNELKEKMASIADKLEKREADLVTKVFVDEDTKKPVNELSKKEISKAFAKAVFSYDKESIAALSKLSYDNLPESRKKALSEGTDAEGGYLVPQEFYNELIVERDSSIMMRNEVKVIQMKRDAIELPKHIGKPVVTWTGENVTKSTTTLNFSRPTLTAYKMAAILYMSDELNEDAAFNMQQIVISEFNTALNEKEELAILQGTGTSQPEGIFVNSSVGSRTASTTLSFDDIINLEFSLPQKYRRGAKFVIDSVKIPRYLRKLKDNDGRYLWQDPVASGQPATFHGYPVLMSDFAPTDEILFANLKEAYWLGDRHQMRVKVTQDSDTTFEKDQTGIRVVQRIGGVTVRPTAAYKLDSVSV